MSTGYEFLGHKEESISKATQMQIVDALCRGERSRASHLLLNLGHAHHSLGADDFFHILNYCARSPDPLVKPKSVSYLFGYICVFFGMVLFMKCLIHWSWNTCDEDVKHI